MISYSIETNIVPVLRSLHQALVPFAAINEVELTLETQVNEWTIAYLPEEFISQINTLLCRIITLTPQKHMIRIQAGGLSDESGNQLALTIINSGTYLGIIEKGMLEGITIPVSISRSNGGTLFEIRYPVKLATQTDESESNHAEYRSDSIGQSPFFQKLREHLRSHFTSFSNIEEAAGKRSPQEGIFIKKVNAVILAHLEIEGFNTEGLAKAMALSRSQLYRKLKPLIGESPSWYIRNFRLLKAKEMLEKDDCTIGEAAFNTGFISQSHFTRAFKQHFGFNPSLLKK